MAFDLSTLNSTLGNIVARNEAGMNQVLSDVQSKADPSAADLMQLQQSSMKYTLSVETQSQMIKVLGDLLKSIVQKSS
ncbi:EscF/YscF/HrpA family type III secretion system needle major subunit [Rugamonas aquatica]|nr:EscF/YscF/HrpA family type III secretion system needle major subunit [Rugamonas aquatica]